MGHVALLSCRRRRPDARLLADWLVADADAAARLCAPGLAAPGLAALDRAASAAVAGVDAVSLAAAAVDLELLAGGRVAVHRWTRLGWTLAEALGTVAPADRPAIAAAACDAARAAAWRRAFFSRDSRDASTAAARALLALLLWKTPDFIAFATRTNERLRARPRLSSAAASSPAKSARRGSRSEMAAVLAGAATEAPAYGRSPYDANPDARFPLDVVDALLLELRPPASSKKARRADDLRAALRVTEDSTLPAFHRRRADPRTR